MAGHHLTGFKLQPSALAARFTIPMAMVISGFNRSRRWFSSKLLSGMRVGGLWNLPTISVQVGQRIRKHANGTSGAHLPVAFHRQGIPFIIARTWWEGEGASRASLKT